MSTARRLLWFAALWAAGVLAVSVVGYAITLILASS
jgi:preprotein translocase subunit Sss1